MIDRELIIEGFESKGAHQVRMLLANHRYSLEVGQIAIEWLASADAFNERKQLEQMAAQTEIAQSSADAAWAAARASQEANRLSKWAIWLSIVAIVVSTAVAVLSVYAQLSV